MISSSSSNSHWRSMAQRYCAKCLVDNGTFRDKEGESKELRLRRPSLVSKQYDDVTQCRMGMVGDTRGKENQTMACNI